MSREYSFTLTVPLGDVAIAEELLELARQRDLSMRLSRKPDRAGCARFYLSFPFSSARPDLAFSTWFVTVERAGWELFGPTYGRWGLR